MLGVRLDPDLEKKLSRYARKTGQTKTQCAKKALEEFLANKAKEDEHDKRTLRGLKEIENGEGTPAEKIFAYLDTWGNDNEI